MARTSCRPLVSEPQNSGTLSYPRYSCVAARPPVIGPEGMINQSTGHRSLLPPSRNFPHCWPCRCPRMLSRAGSSPPPREARMSKKCRRTDGNRITPSSSPPACQGRRTGLRGAGRVHTCSTCTHNEFRVEDVFTDWIDTNTK